MHWMVFGHLCSAVLRHPPPHVQWNTLQGTGQKVIPSWEVRIQRRIRTRKHNRVLSWYTFWIEFDILLNPWGNQIDCFWSSTRQARPWLCQGPLFEAKSLSEGSQKRTQMCLLFGSLFWSLFETSVVGMWGQNGVLKNTENLPFWDTSDLAKV